MKIGEEEIKLKKCYECRSSNIVDGYKETNITNIGTQNIKYFCQTCLTQYAIQQGTYTPSKHVRKLRDTNIEKYLEVVNDFNFIPYSDKFKTAYYYQAEKKYDLNIVRT